MTVLLLLAMFLTFILVDYVVQLRQAKSFVPVAATSRRPLFQTIEDLMPRGVFAAPGHIWSSILPDGKVRLGVSRLMLNALQHVDAAMLPKNGQQVRKGEPIISLKLGNRTIAFRAPMDGTVTAINADLLENPKRLFADVNTAWAVTIQPNNLSESVKSMRIGEEAYQWMRSEVARFRDFFAQFASEPALAPALQDGGLPAAGALQSLNEEAWQAFVQEFIDNSSSKQ